MRGPRRAAERLAALPTVDYARFNTTARPLAKDPRRPTATNRRRSSFFGANEITARMEEEGSPE